MATAASKKHNENKIIIFLTGFLINHIKLMLKLIVQYINMLIIHYILMEKQILNAGIHFSSFSLQKPKRFTIFLIFEAAKPILYPKARLIHHFHY